jgi:hypothetical protein
VRRFYTQSKVRRQEYAVDAIVPQLMMAVGHLQLAGSVHAIACASTVPSSGCGTAPVSNESMDNPSSDSSSFFIVGLLW